MVINCPKCEANNPDTQKFCGECVTQLPSPEDIAVTSLALLSSFGYYSSPGLKAWDFLAVI